MSDEERDIDIESDVSEGDVFLGKERNLIHFFFFLIMGYCDCVSCRLQYNFLLHNLLVCGCFRLSLKGVRLIGGYYGCKRE